MPGPRVAIVEDDSRLRDEFARLVDGAGDMTCVACFPTAEEALSGLTTCAAEVVLMDINLPGMSGVECVRRLRAAASEAQVVMLTAFGDNESVFESLKAGASGYVLKRAPVGEILAAIREVSTGGAPMTGSIARKVVQHFAQRAPAPELQRLTERERDVLSALSEGQQYKEIADALGVSINTVRKHIKGIYDKLHVNTRSEAVRKLGAV
jgi:DNA-binding NarL/FixJ family response regulator